MKIILTKFKINNLTYLIFLSFLLTGFIKNILLILLIIIVHELGHIMFLKMLHYEIENVEIFPFGGVTKTSKYLNSSINKDIIIYLGGFLLQIFLFLIIFNIYNNHLISNNTYNLFNTYNKSILLFNLLPIRPLDGGELLLLILEKYKSFYKSLTIMNYISIISLIIFTLINIKLNLNNYIIISFLLFKIIYNIKNKIIIQNKFLLERYLHNFPYKKIEHNNLKNVNFLKKETLHFFKNNDKYIHEKELLKEKFDINTHF